MQQRGVREPQGVLTAWSRWARSPREAGVFLGGPGGDHSRRRLAILISARFRFVNRHRKMRGMCPPRDYPPPPPGAYRLEDREEVIRCRVTAA